MLRMIFEDSKESAIGKLLSRACEGIVNLDLHLCGGNGMLQKYLEDNYNPEDVYIIYVDVVPDNILTSKVFRRLKKYVRRNCGTNVYLLPIPCMEYYVLKTFLQGEFVSIRNVIENADYQGITCVKSMEQYYKYKLDSYKKECYHIGQFCQVSEQTGIFYAESCICNKGSRDCGSYEIEKKSHDLMSGLPVFKTMAFLRDRCLMKEDPGNICEEYVTAYNEIVDLYTLNKGMNQMQIMQFKI